MRLWDTANGKLRAILTGHTRGIGTIAFSPDSRLLASASHNGKVCLWDVSSGHHQATLIGHTGRVSSVAFTPDGQTLATAGASNDQVRLWDVTSRQHKATLRTWAFSVAFSPDGRTLASGLADVFLWDVATGTQKATLTGHTDNVQSLAFSPDGRTLASGGSDSTVQLWDVAGGTHKTILTGHTGGITSVVFSPDGRTLASASNDATILLWKLTSAPSTGPLTTIDFEKEKAAIQEVYSQFYKAFNEFDFEKVAETMDTSPVTMFGTIFSDGEPIPIAIGWNNVNVFIEGLWRGIGTKGAKWGPDDELTDFWIRQTEASAKDYNCYKGTYPGETYLYLVKTNDKWRIQQIDSITQDNLKLFKDNPRIRNYFTDPNDKAPNVDKPATPQLPEDINGDGVVNIQDLVLVSAAFGQTGQIAADVNRDGIVDIRDLVKVAGEIAP